MPAIIPVVAAAATKAALGTIVTGWIASLAAMAVAVGLSAVLASKPKRPADIGSVSLAGDRTQMVRQPITVWRTLYGEVRVSGPITFLHTTGSTNDTCHVLLTVAGHAVSGFGDIYFNDELVTLDGVNATGRWAGFARVWTGLGTRSGDAALRAALQAAAPDKWTVNHRQSRRAKVYIEFTYDEGMFPSGLPTVSVVARGRMIDDPRDAPIALVSTSAASPSVFEAEEAHGLAVGDMVRLADHALPAADEFEVGSVPTATTFTLVDKTYADVALAASEGGSLIKLKWSPNAVNVVRGYLQEAAVGLGVKFGELDDDDNAASAAVAEERVSVAISRTATLDAGLDRVTLASACAGLKAGDEVRFSTSGSLAGTGLTAGTSYYWIPVSETIGQVAASPEDATAESPVALAVDGAGTGTHTLSRAAGRTFTAAGATITLASALPYLATGDGVTPSTTGTLPAGLSATEYFWSRLTATTGRLCATYADSLIGAGIATTDAGTGTHTLTRTSEPRYAAHGTVDSDTAPKDALGKLLTASAGRVVYSGGKWSVLAGYWRPPTRPALTLDDFDGPIKVVGRVSRRELFNGVKGVFVDPESFWQPTDGPAVSNAAYVSEDQGERIWKDVDLPYTVSPSAFQRIAKIDLEQVRQQITVEAPVKLTALGVRAGDVQPLTIARYGWTDKPFDVVDWTFEIRQDSNDQPYLGIRLFLRETASAVYDWNAGEETTIDPSPDTDLPSPWEVAPPTDVALASGTDTLLLQGDGTVVSRIHVTWTAPASAYVEGIEVQSRRADAAEWSDSIPVQPGLTEAWLSPVKDGVAYDVRVRAKSPLGVRSDWATETGHTVVGKTAPPTDVASFSASQNGITVNFVWTQIADADLAGYEIRYMTAPFVWESAAVLTRVTRGTRITTAAVQPSPSDNGSQAPWVFGIKAVDTSGNYSETAATKSLVVTNAFTVISDNQQWPLWTGDRTGFVRNPLTGNLNPSSDDSESTVEAFFGAYATNPPASCVYVTSEIDLGLDVAARVWTEANANLGPGESGSADPDVEIDYREAAGAYDGFEPWAVGDATLRYAKGRVTVDTATGVARLTGFNVTIDSQARKETGRVAMSGTAGVMPVTFATPFAAAPDVRVFPAGGTPRIGEPSAVTTAGFTALLWDLSGNPVNDTIDWEAEGV